jgi:hypothetical protein
MTHQMSMGARLGIKGAFECRDAEGNILNVIEFDGSIPLENVGLTVDEAQSLIESQEVQNGSDHRE